MALTKINLGSGVNTSGADTHFAASTIVNAAIDAITALQAQVAGLPASSGVGGSSANVVTNGIYLRYYGAIGDGASHPIGGIASIAGTGTNAQKLASIQAYNSGIFSFVTAITEEMDGVALEAAMRVAKVSGGTIEADRGKFLCSKPISAFPVSYTTAKAPNDGGPGVNLRGAGAALTYFKAVSDFGLNTFLLTCDGRGNGQSEGFWQGFSVIGPVETWNSNGSVPGTQMSGLGWNSRRHMDDVHVQYFRNGIHAVGDQAIWKNVTCTHNYRFGCYFDLADPNLYGDFHMDKCSMVENTLAGYGVSHITQMPKMVFTKGLSSSQPMGFCKETNGGNPNQPQLIYDCIMLGMQFENLGECYFGNDGDGSAGSYGYGNVGMGNMTMIDVQFGPNMSSYARPGKVFRSAMEVQNLTGTNYITINVCGDFYPGTNGLFGFAGVDHLLLRGDIDQLISNCNGAANGNKNAFFGNVDFIYSLPSIMCEGRNWSGRWVYNDTGGNAPPAGRVVRGRDALPTPANGDPVGGPYSAPLGISKHNSTSNGIILTLVATTGKHQVLTAVATDRGQKVMVATSGGQPSGGVGPMTVGNGGWPVGVVLGDGASAGGMSNVWLQL